MDKLGQTKITPEIITQVKTALGDIQIFKYAERTKTYELIFTPMTHDLLKEVREIIKTATLNGDLLPVEPVEHKIFDECVVWPAVSEEDKADLPCGLIPDVVKSIQEKSYFLDVDVFERPLRPDDYTEIIRDFEYWEDITPDELDELKEKYKYPLFKTYLDRWVFITRPMLRNDIAVIQAAVDDQLTLCKVCVLWPEVDWDTIPAGVTEVLGKSLLRISAFGESAIVESL